MRALIASALIVVGACAKLDQAEPPRPPEPESWWGRALLGIVRGYICEEPRDAGTDAPSLDGCYTVDNAPGLTDCGAP